MIFIEIFWNFADFVKNCDLMWKQSVWTSIIASHLASKHLKDGGVLALTGAQPALQGTPGSQHPEHSVAVTVYSHLPTPRQIKMGRIELCGNVHTEPRQT